MWTVAALIIRRQGLRRPKRHRLREAGGRDGAPRALRTPLPTAAQPLPVVEPVPADSARRSDAATLGGDLNTRCYAAFPRAFHIARPWIPHEWVHGGLHSCGPQGK